MNLALSKLGNPDRKIAARGKRTLIRGGTASIPLVVTLAQKADPLVKCDVAYVPGKIGDRSALPWLKEAVLIATCATWNDTSRTNWSSIQTSLLLLLTCSTRSERTLPRAPYEGELQRGSSRSFAQRF